jgi:plasmid stabilization system protein ParE
VGTAANRVGAALPLSLPILFTQAAVSELIEAQDWYETKRPGLGAEFRQGVDAVVATIAEQPELYSVVFRNVRRARLRRFPYGLFFCIKPDAVFIIACFHASRDPQQWQGRI